MIKNRKSWFLYIIRTNAGTLYTSVTIDLERRFEEHQSQGKKCAKYLRGKGPLELVHYEGLPDKASAYSLEMKIKRLSKDEKERYIRSSSNEKHSQHIENKRFSSIRFP
ncbi:MAG: GIY-YIG nuclease family protein [Simkaniaceae bacterium]|nr:GIY-YIG nuclease family protein [Legionellales bacterium]NRA89602.1 GIY-YIG nuclease family protein [Simkaniaceae bacterium]